MPSFFITSAAFLQTKPYDIWVIVYLYLNASHVRPSLLLLRATFQIIEATMQGFKTLWHHKTFFTITCIQINATTLIRTGALGKLIKYTFRCGLSNYSQVLRVGKTSTLVACVFRVFKVIRRHFTFKNTNGCASPTEFTLIFNINFHSQSLRIMKRRYNYRNVLYLHKPVLGAL